MLLAIDTATRFISLALHDGQQLISESTWHTANNHTTELAPAIRQMLTQARRQPADLTAIAISQGPGSFTGLRIGFGVTKGLAMAQHIALVAVPTLNIVAAGVPAFEGDLIAVLQVGRKRVCVQRYQWYETTWTPVGSAVITAWEDLLNRVNQKTLFAGEIDAAARTLLTATERSVCIASGAHALRRAGFLAELAWARVQANNTDNPALVVPIYLHQPGVPHP